MIPFHGEVLGLRWPCGPWARRSFHTTPRVAWLPSPRDQGGEAQGATSSARAGVSLVVAVSSFGGAPRPLRNRSKSAQNRSKTCRKWSFCGRMDPFKLHISLPFVPTQSHVLAPPAPISPLVRLKPLQIPGLWGASNPQICTFFGVVTSAIDPTSQNRSATQPDRIRAGNCFQISRIQPPVLAAKDAAVHMPSHGARHQNPLQIPHTRNQTPCLSSRKPSDEPDSPRSFCLLRELTIL